jgi:hypothetical protein
MNNIINEILSAKNEAGETAILVDQSYRRALDTLEPLQQGAKW